MGYLELFGAGGNSSPHFTGFEGIAVSGHSHSCLSQARSSHPEKFKWYLRRQGISQFILEALLSSMLFSPSCPSKKYILSYGNFICMEKFLSW